MLRKLNSTTRNLLSFINTHQSSIIFVLVFLLNLLLVSPELMPNYPAVNPDDEAKYVDSGWRLLRGDIRDMAWGPVIALVYAPVHLMVGGNPDWFLLELWTGRFIMYTFLWWSFFYLGYQLREQVPPYSMVAVLFITTPFISVVVNQSDATFAGFSALALANLVKYHQSGRVRQLGIASVFVGLGVLSRVESIILLVTLVFLGILIGKRSTPLYKILLSATLPIILVIGIYFTASMILTGKIDLGLANKSYDSFEMNQAVLTGGDISLARQETRRLFGTQEENHSSILRAILRNPPAFAARIFANAKTIPINYLTIFGKKLGPALLLFSIAGLYSLARKKTWGMVAILLVWPLHALVALGFLSLHIIPQTIYLPLLLGAIGITKIFDIEAQRVEKLVFLLGTVLLFSISWIIDKPALLVSFLLLGFVLLVHLLSSSIVKLQSKGLHFSILLLLAAGLILREPFQFPNFPSIGKSSAEKAVHYMEAKLTPLSTVLVPTPLPAIAARMTYLTMDNIPASIRSIPEFAEYLLQNQVSAVYLDRNRRGRTDIFDLMEQGTEQYFTLGYTSQDQTVRVFLVK